MLTPAECLVVASAVLTVVNLGLLAGLQREWRLLKELVAKFREAKDAADEVVTAYNRRAAAVACDAVERAARSADAVEAADG
jgi:hypothetical protein